MAFERRLEHSSDLCSSNEYDKAWKSACNRLTEIRSAGSTALRNVLEHRPDCTVHMLPENTTQNVSLYFFAFFILKVRTLFIYVLGFLSSFFNI